MSRDTFRVYYGNVMAAAVGMDHGLKTTELDELIEPVGRIVTAIEEGRARGLRRYRELPYNESLVQAVEAAVATRAGKYDNLVVLGIGGSALGNIALQTALNGSTYNLQPKNKRRGPRLFVLDNVDPVQFAAVLDLLDDQWDRTCVNVISKSGETAETASQFMIVRDLLRRRLGAAAARDRILVTTDARGGTMRRIVDQEKYDALPVPDGVGGRFSVLSPVGLFSAAMCGINIRKILAGAAAMDRLCKNPVLDENPAAILAAVHYLYMKKGKPMHVMMPYSAQLRDLADWFRQLWAESLGKRYDLNKKEVFVGPTPINALGATDQHSQVQLYREGPNDKVITTLAVEKFDRDVEIPDGPDEADGMHYLAGATMGELIEAERRATEQALLASHRPVMTVLFPTVCEETVGQFIYLYECATSILGAMLDINTYDQPAVELGKQYTFALMGRPGHEDTRGKLESQLALDENYLI